jgi:hypothetical protein
LFDRLPGDGAPHGRSHRRVPAWLKRVLAKGLSPNPGDRYPSMNELLHALEHMRSLDDRPSYDALCALVDALVVDGLSPEAVVIAVKDTILQSGCLDQFEPPLRERARNALVASCIDQYYESREARGMTGGSKPMRLWRPPRDDEAGSSA